MSYHSYLHVIDDVSWITNAHYAGIYGLIKLALNKVLPEVSETLIIHIN